MNLETVEDVPGAVYLFTHRIVGEDGDEEEILSQALILMKREGGVLLALPAGALSQEALAAASEGDPFQAFGAHTFVNVRAALQEGVTEEEDLGVLIIDVDSSLAHNLSMLGVEAPEAMLTFSLDPNTLPDPGILMVAARAWVAQAQDEAPLAYYSAVEEMDPEQVQPPGPAASKAKAAPKAKAKRVTTASLAEQVGGIETILPQLTQQIAQLQAGQARIQATMEQQATAVPPRASQMPVSAGLKNFAKMVGSPPRTRAPMGTMVNVPEVPQAAPMTSTIQVQGEEVEHHLPGGGVLAQAVLEQSRALTNLVAQLQQGGGPLLDGQGSSSAFSLGSRGAQGREKLQQELAARSGGFFLSVLCNAFRRMKPATRIPTSIQAAQGLDFSMVSYLEKFGGYGNCREMGLVQYCLAHVFDCALNEDLEGVREHVALLMTSVEQAVQDGNRWDLAYQLTLLEEPPTQLWTYRSPVTQTRLRAFAPLCAQKWATIALAYTKEVDYIQNRKNELAKKPSPSQPSQEPGPNPKPKPKRKPKFSGTVSVGRELLPQDSIQVGSMSKAAIEEGETDLGDEFNAASESGVPIPIWVESHVRRILASRTTFSLYLLRSITLCRQGDEALATALFPIPIPFYGIWDGGLKRMNSAARSLRARRKLLHVAVMALNFLHDRAPLCSLGLLRRRPSRHHLSVYARLMTMIKACVLSGEATIARCGRKSFQLDARIHELHATLRREGLVTSSMYTMSSSCMDAPVDLCNDKAEELRPYRDLDASRLKITGRGQWDCVPYLNDLLFMPYVEPAINRFDILPPADKCPDVTKESPDEVIKLAKVWDAQSLLRLVPGQLAPSSPLLYSRVFNNYKNSLADRQIGDRRGPNFVEGRIDEGPSHVLPSGPSLFQIMPKQFEEGVKGFITDRRDFYRQFKTTWERSVTNVVFPHVPISSLKNTEALAVFEQDFMTKKAKKDRLIAGDDLGGHQKSILVGQEDQVAIAFGALFQGDHLGVEFACSAHETLLKESGLLDERSRLLAHHPICDDEVTDGLVIDDYFALEKFKLGDVRPGAGDGHFIAAKETYASEDIYGSDDKDVRGEKLFKVIGAEVDSRDETVRDGAVLVAAPAGKRLGLASATALASSWSFTSDSLHPSLVGAMVSTLMFRRPMMSILNEVFKVIPPQELVPEAPVLRPLKRSAAEEYALFAALCPIIATNISVPMDCSIYATDASTQMGGIASTKVPEQVAKMMWRSADMKGENVPLRSRVIALLQSYGDIQEDDIAKSNFDLEEEKGGGDHVERPIGLRFQFAEVFGRAGVVTKHLCSMSVVCCPVLDISYSPHYNITSARVIAWINFMLESGRLLAVLVAPPCTTFSPAAHPACRSYENPLGFNRKAWKVILGNQLAGGALSIIFTCRRTRSPGMIEQPRRSKMRWLTMWRQLLGLGMQEIFLASCSFGSIHMKEFCLGTICMDATQLARPCTRDHEHVKIQGAYTKPSATYCEGLAREIAEVFYEHIKLKIEVVAAEELKYDGLEDPLSNDVALSYPWTSEDSWKWKGQSHINLLETASTLRLMRKKALGGGNCRFVYLGDSHVSRSSLARGRTSSDAMRPFLKQSAALQVAFGLYPAGRFTPTRMMPADFPSRGKEIPPPVPCSISKNQPIKVLQFLAKMPKRRRWVSSWARLVLLLSPSVLDFWTEGGAHRIYPLDFSSQPLPSSGFDSTLGFPGEGPMLGLLAFLLLQSLQSRVSASCVLLGCSWVLPGVLGVRVPSSFTSHGDLRRQEARTGIELGDGRRTTEVTSAGRVELLSRFIGWMADQGSDFEEVFLANPPNLDLINKWLVDFGRWLFKSGKPYYHYSETVNAVASRRPVLRRSLQQAWDLAFMWGSYEPTEHHTGMPFQVLLSVLSVMLVWGWRIEAACIALSWGSLLRIGEVFQAVREDLVLPSDVAGSIQHVLIRIREPKTRFRAAKHQTGKMEQPDLITVVELGFKDLSRGQPLWPFSGATLRQRFSKVLQALGLPHRPGQRPKALTLASLRAGGATWLITATESADLVQRRGRWVSRKVMEVYLQEVGAASYLSDLSKDVRQHILTAMEMFPEVLVAAQRFTTFHIPSATWTWFFTHGTE
eukprot:Skav203076  [mRNA]  locus=scaffold2182:29521:36002:+ [translate_table: standard]